MLKLDIHTLCRLNNQTNARAYLTKSGFSHWVSHKLTHNKTNSISLSDLEKLCKVFKCTPNDLFEWIPDKKEEDTPQNPLAPLKKDKNIDNTIRSLSYAQLKEIAKIVKEKK